MLTRSACCWQLANAWASRSEAQLLRVCQTVLLCLQSALKRSAGSTWSVSGRPAGKQGCLLIHLTVGDASVTTAA